MIDQRNSIGTTWPTDEQREALDLELARADAEREDQIRSWTDRELHDFLDGIKAAFANVLDQDARMLVLADVERCQDELDRRLELAHVAALAEDIERAAIAEFVGRHRLVEVDDRPTQIGRSTGTLDLPVVEVEDPTVQFDAVEAPIDDNEFGLYDDQAPAEDRWDTLEHDLGEPGWWASNVTARLNPRRRFLLTVVATVVVTWGAAWLVMGR